MKNKKKKLFRYTTNGEGVFSAGRRLLDRQSIAFIEQMLLIIRNNSEWLVLPELEHDNLEFFWTEHGKKNYEHYFLSLHSVYLSDITLSVYEYDELPGTIVYEDEYQIGILAAYDKSHLPNPYRARHSEFPV